MSAKEVHPLQPPAEPPALPHLPASTCASLGLESLHFLCLEDPTTPSHSVVSDSLFPHKL